MRGEYDYSSIVKATASRVQGRASLRGAAYLCLQAMLVAALACASRAAHAQGHVTAQPPPSSPAPDTSPAALVAARELFREATSDADAGNHAVALEKFQRVARVRESAAVRFNIGNCEEKLGRLGSALASYELALQLARREPRGEELAATAHAAAEALRGRVPRLTLSLGGAPPRDITVSLDGATLSTASLGVGLPVDPGSHVVEADAPGRRHGRWAVALAEGQAETLAVTLVPADGPPPGAVATTSASGALGTRDVHDARDADESWWTPRRGVGIGALAVGATAAIVSVVFVVQHNSAVLDLRAACVNGCPASRRADLETIRERAVTDQSTAIASGVIAGVAAATGALLVLWPSTSPKRTRSAAAPFTFVPAGLGARLDARF